MTHHFTRRQLLGSALSLALIAALPGAALSATEAEARGPVDRLVADINAVITAGKSEAAMIADFERIFITYADMPYIAAYALGADGRRASPAQKKAFSAAFQGYVARKYGKQFRKFIGGRIEVNGASKVKKA